MCKIKDNDGTTTATFSDFFQEPALGFARCLICGKSIQYSIYGPGVEICEECKQAVAWAKEKMKEKKQYKPKQNAKTEQLP